jgi:flagellar hook capping protein FlgD
VIAYPSTAVIGHFPTCINNPLGFVVHATAHTEVRFGNKVDFENDGNAGPCIWPPYDKDECFNDGDAGLILPDGYTIIGSPGIEVTCAGQPGRPLGRPCTAATWGPAGNIDINVVNTWPGTMFVNLLIDWDQNGVWAGGSSCGAALAPEHVLMNFPVPSGYIGSLSGLGPPSFLIGPNTGFVWARFTIGEVPVAAGWNGAHIFDLGETEDYLLRVSATGTDTQQPPRRRLGLELEPSMPNPFNPSTTIAFTLETAGKVRLAVYDMAGRQVALLLDAEQTAGRHQMTWNGTSDNGSALPSGLYIVRAESGAMLRTQKISLVK